MLLERLSRVPGRAHEMVHLGEAIANSRGEVIYGDPKNDCDPSTLEG